MINKKFSGTTKTFVYRAPTIYVALFYLLMLAWTIISVLYMGGKGWVSWTQIFMVAFVFMMTWYFSLGISYKVEINDQGKLELLSFRRLISTDSSKIEMVEGPHLPIGFIRFRLEREKAYLFGIPTNKDLQEILLVIHKTNPDIRFKNLRFNP